MKLKINRTAKIKIDWHTVFEIVFRVVIASISLATIMWILTGCVTPAAHNYLIREARLQEIHHAQDLGRDVQAGRLSPRDMIELLNAWEARAYLLFYFHEDGLPPPRWRIRDPRP